MKVGPVTLTSVSVGASQFVLCWQLRQRVGFSYETLCNRLRHYDPPVLKMKSLSVKLKSLLLGSSGNLAEENAAVSLKVKTLKTPRLIEFSRENESTLSLSARSPFPLIVNLLFDVA